jgi:hypothetical protein
MIVHLAHEVGEACPRALDPGVGAQRRVRVIGLARSTEMLRAAFTLTLVASRLDPRVERPGACLSRWAGEESGLRGNGVDDTVRNIIDMPGRIPAGPAT